ncbi:male-specific protein scotti [Drosophila bipectinata]|uniref:male-specific protein scotti n=1 Tax=Drosophila bipectinata TaxID=42026 RepID=UPI001C8A1A0B|nr:male-specific protein scotti [Drosophila bipectinata]
MEALDPEGLDRDPHDMLLIDRIGDAVAVDDGNDSDSQEQEPLELHHQAHHALRRDTRRVAMLLDAPLEPPPVGPFQAAQPRPAARSKKRSFLTIVRPTVLRNRRPEVCSLFLNASRAMHDVREEQRAEFFAEYLFENMTSENYPNGAGLPHHWGEF